MHIVHNANVISSAPDSLLLPVQGTRASALKISTIVRTEREQHKLKTLLAQRYREREGGCTRVIRTRARLGDAAPMSLIEFIDRPGELRTPRPPRAAVRSTVATSGHSLLPASAQPLAGATE